MKWLLLTLATVTVLIVLAVVVFLRTPTDPVNNEKAEVQTAAPSSVDATVDTTTDNPAVEEAITEKPIDQGSDPQAATLENNHEREAGKPKSPQSKSQVFAPPDPHVELALGKTRDPQIAFSTESVTLRTLKKRVEGAQSSVHGLRTDDFGRLIESSPLSRPGDNQASKSQALLEKLLMSHAQMRAGNSGEFLAVMMSLDLGSNPACKFSPAGKYLLTQGSKAVALWDLSRRKILGVIETGYNSSVVLGADDRWLAILKHDVLQLYRTEDLSLFETWDLMDARIVAFAPSGKQFMAGRHLCNLESGELRAGALTLREAPPGRTLRCAAYSGDGTTIATGYSDGYVALWNSDTARQIGRIEGIRNPIQQLHFSTTGRYLLTLERSSVAHVWDLSGGTEKPVLFRTFTNVQSIQPSRNGDTVWINLLKEDGKACELQCIKLQQGSKAAALTLPVRASSLSRSYFHPERSFFVLGSFNVLDRNDPTRVRRIVKDQKVLDVHPVEDLILSSVNSKNKFYLWHVWSAEADLPQIPLRATLLQKRAQQAVQKPLSVWRASYAPDGKRLGVMYSNSAESSVTIWDAKRHEPRTEIDAQTLYGKLAWVRFASSAEHVVRVFNAKYRITNIPRDVEIQLRRVGGQRRLSWSVTAEQARRLGRVRVSNMVFSPDDQLLAIAWTGSKASIDIWKLQNVPRHLATLVGAQGNPSTNFWMTFSPNGDYLAAGRFDADLWLWKIDADEDQPNAKIRMRLPTLAKHTAEIYCAAFTPDSQTCITAGRAGQIKMWDVNTGQQRGELTGHRESIYAIAVSPDGSLVAAGGDRYALSDVTIWSLADQRTVAVVRGHTKVRAIAFAPDEPTLAVGDSVGAVKLWDVGAIAAGGEN